MIDMHSKYDNIHKNGIFSASIFINNHVIIDINYMLLESLALACGKRADESPNG